MLYRLKKLCWAWPDVLELAAGMPITILTNINFEQTTLLSYKSLCYLCGAITCNNFIVLCCRKVNGASGIIHKVYDKFIEVLLHDDKESLMPEFCFVFCNCGLCISHANIIYILWCVCPRTKYIKMEHQQFDWGGMVYHRYQLPIDYNFANTIHKGQGQTCDRVITSINKEVCT